MRHSHVKALVRVVGDGERGNHQSTGHAAQLITQLLCILSHPLVSFGHTHTHTYYIDNTCKRLWLRMNNSSAFKMSPIKKKAPRTFL